VGATSGELRRRDLADAGVGTRDDEVLAGEILRLPL